MKVLVTRSRRRAWELAHPLKTAGFEPVNVPLLELVGIPGALMPFVLYEYDILLLTSAAAVDAVVGAYDAGLKEIERVYAVGPTTAAAAEARGLELALIPDVHTAAHAIDRMGVIWEADILWPSAKDVTSDTLDRMRGRGADVHQVAVYENVAPDGHEARLAQAAKMGIDVITLMSGSAARRLAASGVDFGDAKVVVIGPTTAAVAESVGLTVHAVADPHTVEGVVQAVAAL